MRETLTNNSLNLKLRWTNENNSWKDKSYKRFKFFWWTEERKKKNWKSFMNQAKNEWLID